MQTLKARTDWIGDECQEYDYCSVLAAREGAQDRDLCQNDGSCINLVFDTVQTAEVRTCNDTVLAAVCRGV